MKPTKTGKKRKRVCSVACKRAKLDKCVCICKKKNHGKNRQKETEKPKLERFFGSDGQGLKRRFAETNVPPPFPQVAAKVSASADQSLEPEASEMK